MHDDDTSRGGERRLTAAIAEPLAWTRALPEDPRRLARRCTAGARLPSDAPRRLVARHSQRIPPVQGADAPLPAAA